MSMYFSGRNARRGLAVLLPLGLISCGLALAGNDTPRVREKKMVIRIAQPGEGTFLGVALDGDEGQPADGARVIHVVPESPASRAGLENGDIVIEFGDQPVHDAAGLSKQVRAKGPGDDVRIVVLRGGKKETLQAELAARGEDGEPSVFKIDDLDLDLDDLDDMGEGLEGLDADLGNLGQHLEGLDLHHLADGAAGHRIRIVCKNGDCKHYGSDESDRPVLGVQIVDTTPELNRHLGGEERAGVLISKVIDGSAAEAAGIRVGDLIVSVAGQEVSDVGDVRGAIGDKAGQRVQVEVIRDHVPKTIQVQLPELETK